MLFFSILLFCFELTQIKRVEWIEFSLQRNFGFLYGTLGKSLYIILLVVISWLLIICSAFLHDNNVFFPLPRVVGSIAFLSFGLGDPESLTFGTGCSMAVFGFLQLGLYLKYPEQFE
jgi:hypothetical protein